MSDRIDTKAVLAELKADVEWMRDPIVPKPHWYAETILRLWDALAQEIANREALERQGRRAELALRSVKALVLEERRPENDFMNTQTRGHIADLCDNALMFPRADAALDAEETTTIYATTISDEDGHSLGDDAALAAEEKP